MVTKQQIVQALMDIDYIIDGKTDWKRIQSFVAKEFGVKLSKDAFWAVFRELEGGGLTVLDFN